MPEHVHLLISEPQRGDPSKVMQAIKQGFARRILRKLRAASDRRQSSLWKLTLAEGHIWQARFYDFVVFSEKKRAEKLRYMHRNPVKRGLVIEPQQWKWSSYRHYAAGERGIVLVNEEQRVELKVRKIA
jgi:putative transposase